MAEYPKPEIAAKKRREDAEEASPGVARDMLADATADAYSAHHLLQECHVLIDSVADDRGLFPREVHRDLRECQRVLQEASQWSDEFREELKSEHDSLVQEENL